MKKNTLLTFVLITFMGFSAFSQTDKAAYKIYTAIGQQVSYQNMLDEIQNSEILFFGELHNNAVSHWLELEITKDLFQKNNKIILGAEMFEADNQLIMNEYLAGLYTSKKFEAEIKLWDNYKTDYKPLVQFAKQNKLNFIATNIPRRYANVVFKNGFEGLNGLSEEAKKYFAPLPINYDNTVKCYADMVEMGKRMGHGKAYFPEAQAIKDATMAYFITENYKKDYLFIHYTGSYHSDNKEGIVWHLMQGGTKYKIATITTVEQKDINTLSKENLKTADFIIVIPESFTKTY